MFDPIQAARRLLAGVAMTGVSAMAACSPFPSATYEESLKEKLAAAATTVKCDGFSGAEVAEHLGACGPPEISGEGWLISGVDLYEEGWDLDRGYRLVCEFPLSPGDPSSLSTARVLYRGGREVARLTLLRAGARRAPNEPVAIGTYPFVPPGYPSHAGHLPTLPDGTISTDAIDALLEEAESGPVPPAKP